MIDGRPISRWFAAMALMAVGWLTALPCPALPPSDGPEPKPKPLEFRRVYVPANEVEDWPRDGARYVPMAKDEFERLIKAAQSDAGPPAFAPRITRAHYVARLEGDQLVGDRALLDILVANDERALLSLDGCGLPIVDPTWQADPPTSATVGMSADGKLVALVEKSSQLKFQWSLRGVRRASGSLHFTFQPPACPSSRLTLDLPAAMAPEVDRGIVIGSEVSAPPDGGSDSAKSTPDPRPMRRWHIELGGHNPVALRIVPEKSPAQRGRLVVLRQSQTYRISQRGLALHLELKLDVHNQPLRRLTLRLDPTLQLTAARNQKNQPVPWTISTDDRRDVSQVVLQFPEPIQGADRTLQLEALAPLTPDVLWRLPTVRPQDVLWQEGTATLLVQAPLSLEQLTTEGCRQSKFDILPAQDSGRSGESFEFQFYGPDATLMVVVARRAERIELRRGTTIQLGASATTAQVSADLTSRSGERFQLEAVVPQPWIVDSVQSRPPEAIDDWSTSPLSPTERRLEIRLRKALKPDQDVHLGITGHRNGTARNVQLAVEHFRFVEFQDVKVTRRLMSIQTQAPNVLNLVNDSQLTRLDPQALGPPDAELVDARSGGLVFVVDSEASKLNVALSGQQPRYSADIRIEADVLGQSLKESYVIDCRPESPDSAPIGRLRVRLSQTRSEPLKWLVANQSGPALAARRLPASEQPPSPLGKKWETWEIDFPRPRSAPFQLQASRTCDLAEGQPISLLSLPSATTQRATLTIRSKTGAPLAIENRRLTSIPAKTSPHDGYTTARAVYRYDPSNELLGSEKQAAIVVSRAGEDAQPAAWAWSCHLQSRYATAGTAVHTTTYRIQNTGLEQVRLTLPPEMTLHEVLIGDVSVSVDSVSDGNDALAIALPPGLRFPTLTVHFGPGGRLSTLEALEPPIPKIDIPVMQRRWTVWLPPGYAALVGDVDHPRRPGLLERLLGPLARPRHRRPFDPLSGQDWRALAPASNSRDSAVAKAGRFLESLGTLAGQDRDTGANTALTWHTLLSRYRQQNARGPRLLIDDQVLSPTRLLPQTPAAERDGVSARQRGISLLQRSNMALLVQDDAMLLTGAATLASHAGQLAPCDDDVVACVRPGVLSEQLSGSPAGDSPFVDVDAWLATPQPPRRVWKVSPRPAYDALSSRGWTSLDLEITGPRRPRLLLYRPATIRALGWAMFLFTASLAWWTAARHPRRFVWLFGLSGTAALLVPAPYVPLGTGAFLGVLFCGVLRLTRSAKPTALAGRSQGAARSMPVSQVGYNVLLIGLLVTAWSALSSGQDPQPAAPLSGPPLSVFIPVDDQLQPTGDKYFVSDKLYQTIHRRAEAAGTLPQDWLIRSAAYRGTLTREADQSRLEVAPLIATYEIEVFQGSTQIRIPLERRGVNLLQAEAKLDGRAIQVEWLTGGSALALAIDTPGRYHLELALRPTTRRIGLTRGFEIAIPRLPSSTLELQLPLGASTIQVPSARGAVQFDAETGRLRAELGPADRLNVSWPDMARRDATTDVQIEQLLWLSVRPGSVVVHAKFNFAVLEGRIRQLQLVVDSRLRLLSHSPDAIETVILDRSDGRQTIGFELPEPVSGRLTLWASFQLVNASGIGNLRLPRLEASPGRTTRLWTAVSIDPDLAFEEISPEPLERLDEAEFAGAWGAIDDAAPIQLAYRLKTNEPNWSLATRPRRPKTTARQVLTMSFGRKEADLRFDARLVTSDGNLFQHRLSVPAELQIETVSVVQLAEGSEHVARWTRNEAGSVVVFLTGPVSDEQQLVLRGKLPLPPGGELRLPQIRLAEADVELNRFEFYRRPRMLAEIVDMSGLVPVAGDTSRHEQNGLGRLIDRLQASEEQFGATIRLTPNNAEVRGTLVTSIQRESDAWSAEVDYRIDVQQGAVDELRFEIPPEWSGPFKVDPILPQELKVIPGQRERQLVLWLSEPVTSDYRLRIRGPLTVSADDRRIRVPRVTPLDVTRWDQFVVLPDRIELQQIEWERRGLSAAPLPPPLDAVSGGSQSYAAPGDFEATLRSAERVAGSPKIHLADVHIAWRPNGTCQGVATFDLEPAGLSECTLQWPANYRLIQATVAGLPATVTGREDVRRLTLGPNRLPQRIEIVFAGTLPPSAFSGAAWRLPAPWPRDVPVERTLWTIHAPASAAPGNERAMSNQITAAGQDLVRLNSATELIELPSDVAAAEAATEIADWYHHWARRAAELRYTIDRAQARSPYADESTRSQLNQLERRQDALAQRLRTTDVKAKVDDETALAGAAPDPSREPFAAQAQTMRFRFEGAARSITVSSNRTQAGMPAMRWLVALMLAAGAVLVHVAIRRDLLGEWPIRWPHAAGVLIGLVWWLWLTPSLLGWVIILASLVRSFHAGWNVAGQTTDSTVVLRSELANRSS